MEVEKISLVFPFKPTSKWLIDLSGLADQQNSWEEEDSYVGPHFRQYCDKYVK